MPQFIGGAPGGTWDASAETPAFQGVVALTDCRCVPALCTSAKPLVRAKGAPSTRTTLGLRSPRARSFAAHLVVDELPHRLTFSVQRASG